MVWLAKGPNGSSSHGFELVMGHGDDDGIVRTSLGLLHRGNAVLVLGFYGVGPGVEYVGLHVVVGELFDNIDHAGVAQVRAIFFKGQAHHQNACTLHRQAAFGHGFDQLGDYVGTHAVVQTAARQDDLGVVTNGLGLVRQVVWVHTNTVAADQTGAEGQKVPLAASGLQHGFRVYAHFVEDECQLVDESNVDVALGVFNYLSCFGHLDTASLVGACGNDLVVKRIDQVRYFWSGARSDLFDGGDAVLFVAGVYTLWAVAAEKVLVELNATELFQHGHAIFFGATGVHGGFVNDDIARLEHLANGFAGFDERR